MLRLLPSLLMLLGTASAHEKWFIEAGAYPLRPELILRPLPLALIAAVLLAALVAAWWQRRRDGRGLLPSFATFGATAERLALLYALIPAILAAHLAVPLLVSGVEGRLFSPNVEIPGGWAYPLGLLEVGVALALFYGGFTRAAAALLALLWVAGLFFADGTGMLDNLHYLGFAAFFYLAGRGPISVGRLVLPNTEPPAHLARFAVPALRIGVALSLIAVAFSEKFANLPLALAFLQQYPVNFLGNLGLPVTDEAFVLLAGSVELLVGVFLLFNLFPREIIVLAWLPFNLTLTVFGWEELVGHLPFYGVMALLLTWDHARARQAQQTALWERGLHHLILPSRPRE